MANPLTKARMSKPQKFFDKSDPITWPERKRTRYGWMITGMLFFLMMLNWADKAVLGLAAVPIMRDLQISPEVFGLLNSAMFLTFVIAQIFAAPFIDRLPTKWVLLGLALTWSIAQVPIITLATLPALWAGRLILGAGEGPSSPVSLHSIYKWFPSHKRAAPGAVASAGAMVGLAIFAPVLAWSISRFGWVSAFVVLAIAGVVWGAIWIFVGKEGPFGQVTDKTQKAELKEEAARNTEEYSGKIVPLWRSMLTPTWILTLLTSFFAYWTFTVAMSWAPAYFQTELGMSGTQAGSAMALPAIWGTVAMLGLSAISQRLQVRGIPTRKSRAWVLGAGAIITGGALLLGLLVTETWMTVALMSIGFGTAPALFPLALLITTELTTPNRRGANLSLANAVQTSAGLFAPAITGFIIGGATSSALGYSTAFALAGGLTLSFGILCIIFVNQQRERRRLGIDEGTSSGLVVS